MTPFQSSSPGPAKLPFTTGHFIEYILSLDSVKPIWERHIRHPFVLGLGSGTLPPDSFKYYLVQDYLFLNHYARVACQAASKAPKLADVFAQAEYVLSVREELKMHLEYCSTHFGIEEAAMAATPEHHACSAYTTFVREIGEREDWLAMQVALAPCMYGYKIVGEYLSTWDGSVRGRDNKYWSWVEQYTGNEYREAVAQSTELLEKYAARQTYERVGELVDIFKKAAELEIGFWDMGLEDQTAHGE